MYFDTSDISGMIFICAWKVTYDMDGSAISLDWRTAHQFFQRMVLTLLTVTAIIIRCSLVSVFPFILRVFSAFIRRVPTYGVFLF